MTWHWLVQQGVYRDIIAAIVGVLVTSLAAWRPFNKLQRENRKQADMLDTSTPGGLTDVLNAIMTSRPSDKGGDSDGI